MWFENQHPTWKRHVLAVDVPRPLNADCWDVDGDGVPEVVLAYRFEPSPEKSVGNVVLAPQWRRTCGSRGRPRRLIVCRRRTACDWIDPEGNGKKVLLVAPMVGRRYPPGFDDPVPIYVTGPARGNGRRFPACRRECCTRSTPSVGTAGRGSSC